MSKALAARYQILGAGPDPNSPSLSNRFEIFGDVLDTSLDGFTVTDAAINDLIYDENTLNGLHTRYKIIQIIGTGAGAFVGATVNSLRALIEFDDEGSIPLGGPVAGSGAICSATAFGLSEIPAWTLQSISQSLANRIRNIDARTVIDPNLGGGGGSSDFISLTDTPSSYTGQAGKIVAVNENSPTDGVEFIDTIDGGTLT